MQAEREPPALQLESIPAEDVLPPPEQPIDMPYSGPASELPVSELVTEPIPEAVPEPIPEPVTDPTATQMEAPSVDQAADQTRQVY